MDYINKLNYKTTHAERLRHAHPGRVHHDNKEKIEWGKGETKSGRSIPLVLERAHDAIPSVLPLV